jgi:hypothetical protein
LSKQKRTGGLTMASDMITRAAAIDYLMTNLVWHDEDGYEVDDADEKKAIITDLVNGIPAVDAVPVEWLESKERELLDTEDKFNYRRADSIRLVILMWQKEQEAQDG